MIPTGVTRRQFVATAAATGAFAFLPDLRRFAKRPPNVLFILADDMGYGDLSSFGRPDYKTPVLDRFARDGLRLTSVYTAGAVCTPTRCAWVTGRYPQRLPIGLVEPLMDGDNSVGLPTGHPTVASLVKAVGYDTSLIGKWHLGFLPEHHPLAHGFDVADATTASGFTLAGEATPWWLAGPACEPLDSQIEPASAVVATAQPAAPAMMMLLLVISSPSSRRRPSR